VLAPTNGDKGRSTIALPPTFSSSPSYPPPCPSASSSPPPGELDPLSSEFSYSSSSSPSMSWNSTYFLCSFYFFIPLDFLTSSSHITIGILIFFVSDNFSFAMGTRNSFGHSLIICSISSSASL
jgi:hypothetical protein